jgi:hypothetical protein
MKEISSARNQISNERGICSIIGINVLAVRKPKDAHHLTVEGDKRRLLVAYLRYYDSLVKADGVWLFAERLLYVDWLEERAL